MPGAVELPPARRRRLRAERRTRLLGVVALLSTGAVGASEVWRVWRRGSAPLPAQADDVVIAGAEAIGQTVEVAVEGYRAGTTHENALLNMLGSFTLTWAVARSSTHVIHRRGAVGPFRHLVLGKQHIHHFVPGIALAFLSDGAAVVTRRSELDPCLAVPFGMGVALTLDESALLLKLDDVYWTEDGIVSVQVTLAVLALLSTLALLLRVLRRGEAAVLATPPGPRLDRPSR